MFGNGAIRWAGILNFAVLGASAGWITFYLSKHVRPDRPTFDLALAFILSLGLFISPHLYAPDNIVLVVPMLLFYETLRSQPEQRWLYAIFAAILPAVILADVFWIKDSLIVHVPTLYLMVLLAWMGFNLKREIQRANPCPPIP